MDIDKGCKLLGLLKEFRQVEHTLKLVSETRPIFRRSRLRNEIHPSSLDDPRRLKMEGMVGITVLPQFAKTLQEFEKCEALFDPNGKKVENSAGQNICYFAGYRTTHWMLSGKLGPAIENTLRSTFEWASRNKSHLIPAVLSGISNYPISVIGDGVWFDIIAAIKRIDGSSLIRIGEAHTMLCLLYTSPSPRD